MSRLSRGTEASYKRQPSPSWERGEVEASKKFHANLPTCLVTCLWPIPTPHPHMHGSSHAGSRSSVAQRLYNHSHLMPRLAADIFDHSCQHCGIRRRQGERVIDRCREKSPRNSQHTLAVSETFFLFFFFCSPLEVPTRPDTR